MATIEKTERIPRVLISGNPNAGKTTLFNRLAGVRAKTANYPGVTVDRRTASYTVGDTKVQLVDIPGTYSLTARSPEEAVAVSAVFEMEPADIAIVVVDATTMRRGLYFANQVLSAGTRAVVALNMADEARKQKIEIDIARLSESLGAPVVPVAASTGEGFDALTAALKDELNRQGSLARGALELDLEAATEDAITQVSKALSESPNTDGETTDAALNWDSKSAPALREFSIWALLSADVDADAEVGTGSGDSRAKKSPSEQNVISDALRKAVIAARNNAERANVDLDLDLVGARYAVVDALVDAHVTREALKGPSRSERIDAVLTHPLWGIAVFAAVMFVLFESLFLWADPFIGLIEDGVALTQGLVMSFMSEGVFRDLLVDGAIAGVGNVIVFVPQIALLFFLIALMEDSGYLARVAFVIDRLMAAVGLHGKAFVPLLSGFACAIPSIMSTRTISDRKDRLVTMMALPLMSCSARLPVYVLVTAVVFAGYDRVFGVFSVGAVVLFAMYVLSVIATLGAAAVLRRTVLKGPRPTLVLELPAYRVPLLRNLLMSTWSRVRSFLVDAGTVILALSIVLWALLTFPKNDEVIELAEAERTAAQLSELTPDEREARLEAIDVEEQSALLRSSFAGKAGRAIEPIIEPLGMDWRVGIGVIGAFAAREVFVSTLGIVFGTGAEEDEESESLRSALSTAERRDGSPLMTPVSGIALLVFFVLACQCMSTLAVIKRESGGYKWPAFVFVYMTILAYVAAFIVFQVGTALFGGG